MTEKVPPIRQQESRYIPYPRVFNFAKSEEPYFATIKRWLNEATMLRQHFARDHVSTMFPSLATRGNIVAATKYVSELIQKHSVARNNVASFSHIKQHRYLSQYCWKLETGSKFVQFEIMFA